MAEKITGFVDKIKTREGSGARGPWKSDSAAIQPSSGGSGKWVNFGFRQNPNDNFPLKEGDFIEVEAEMVNGYLTAVKGTLKRPKNPPEKPKAQNSSRGNFQGNRGGGYSGGQKFDGTGIQNRTNPEDAKRMSYANARSTAVDVLKLLIENKAIPLSAASGKASEAKRYEEVMAALDKLTVRFHNDGLSLRLLESVADEGKTEKKAEGDLPPENVDHPIDKEEDAPPPREEEDFDDDIPF